MITDVHRHLVAKDTVQGDYIRGAQKSFAMMYRKTHKVDMTDKEFTEKVVRPLIDQNGDNIIEEMDIAFTDEEINQILGGSAQKVLRL
jgi:Fe-S cluster assembly iron-binding protein IscA